MKIAKTLSCALVAIMASGTTWAAEPLKVGVLATLEGTYTVLGEDGVRGLRTALAVRGEEAGGREIELVIQSTDASPDSAVRGARKLVEQDKVDLVIGPLSVGEDYSFIYTQVFGFALEYCQAGGEITDRIWVPLGTKDFGSIIAQLPDDVDAIYLGLGGGDAVNFLNQYQQAGGEANLIGGSIMVDGSVLSSKGSAKEALIGVPSSGPQSDTWDNEEWQDYVKAYQDAFEPDARFPSPSLLATGYYNATTAAMTCLDEVEGDLSDGHKALRSCLRNLELEAPNGKIVLDGNRQAIGTNFVNEVFEQEDGTLLTKVVSIKENVNQTLGIDPEKFAKIGLPSRETPVCKATY